MQRIKLVSLCVLCALCSTTTLSAHADSYADEFAKCLVVSTTPAQKIELIQWLFATMALHPSVAPMAHITDSERESMEKQTAKMFTKLVTVSCRKQAQQAVLFDGPAALQGAFSILGKSAMLGLMSDPNVTKGLSDMDKYMDRTKLEQFLAGLPAAPAPSASSH